MGILSKHNFQLNLRFEKDDRRVVPGSVTRGEVDVTVKSKTKITAIRVKLLGLEQIECMSWGNGANRETRKKPAVASDKRKVFEQNLTLFGYARASGRRGGAELEAGTYSYPFEFTLPGNMPPSVYFSNKSAPPPSTDGCPAETRVDTATASITYTATVSAVIPYGFDAQFTTYFTVASVIPARLVATRAQTPGTVTIDRELLAPDWSGWRACLSRCCASFRGCVEGMTGPYPHVQIQLNVWDSALALEKDASVNSHRSQTRTPPVNISTPTHGGMQEMQAMALEEERMNDYDSEQGAFSPVSPADVIVVANNPTTVTGAMSGIPLVNIPSAPWDNEQPQQDGDRFPEATTAQTPTPAPAPTQPPQRQTPQPTAPNARSAPNQAVSRPAPAPSRPVVTPQYYHVLYSIPSAHASRHACLLDFTLKNVTYATRVSTVHISLVQVQKVTAGDLSTCRVLPIFECNATVSTPVPPSRVPNTQASLRPGETSARIAIEVPLPQTLVETPDEFAALLASSAGSASPCVFLPTMSTPHINVYTMLTIDAPGVTFSEGADESRLVLMSNALKVAALEDVSNTATGVYTKEMLVPELAFGADEL